MRKAKQSETLEMPKHPNVEIAVKNFGPIAKGTVDLRPLTVFVGPSNTGKTYFSTLIYALHGIFEGFSRLPLLNHVGSLFSKVVLDPGSSVDASLSEAEIRESLEKLKAGSQAFKFSVLPQRIRDDVRAGLKNSEIFAAELKRCFDLDSVSKLLRLSGEQQDEMAVSLSVREANQELWGFEMRDSGAGITVDERINEDMLLRPEEDSIFNAPFLYLAHAEPASSIENFKLSRNPIKNLQRYYLPASRSGAMQSHAIIASALVARATRAFAADAAKVSTLSGGLADFLQRLILYKENGIPNTEMFAIANALEANVLAGKIIAKLSPSGYPEFRYRPRETEEEMRLSHASAMVSELAPLVLFVRGGIHPGDTLIIEEPEAHLHPGAQAEVAVILARLVRAGVRVVVTTHSDWLLQEIANLIREGELEKLGEKVSEPPIFLRKEQVGVWLFKKEGAVEEIEYNRIEGVEPLEYGEVAEQLYNRMVDLRNRLKERAGENKG